MKRIYYGSITLDVAEVVAQRIVVVHTSLTDSVRTHDRRFGGRNMAGSETVPFAAGTTRYVTVSGYLNGGDEADVELVLGGSIPIAIAPQSPARPDPIGTGATIDGLERYGVEADV